jgi:hypothetical protein
LASRRRFAAARCRRILSGWWHRAGASRRRDVGWWHRAGASRPRDVGHALFGIAFALLAGCNLDNPGDEPPRGTLYFPNALALSPHEPGSEPRYLFVANSNFDLRYKAGSVQAFSLDRLDEETEGCTVERPCEPIEDTELVLEDEVLVSSFSTALTASPDGRYLFATTRTDDSLTFIALDSEADGDDVLDCGGSGRGCNLNAERGPNANDPGEPLKWPNDPASVISGPLSDWSDDASPDALYAMVAHRGGEVSLFVEQPSAPRTDPRRFELQAVFSGLPPPLTNIAFDPSTRLAHVATGASALARVGVVPADAAGSDSDTASLYLAGFVTMQSLAAGALSRDLVFTPALPDAGEALAEDSALIVAVEPSALLLADVNETRNAPGRARVKRTAVVGGGASRLAFGDVGGRPTAVVACFDARALFIIDVETMLTISVVPNLSGPFEIELDEERQRVYVADFRSSVIRVVDLSQLAGTQGGQSAGVIATLGKPRVIQELR